MLSPVERLRRICTMIRLDIHKTFHWGITDADGVWIETDQNLNSEQFKTVERNALLHDYEVLLWEVKGSAFIVKLKQKGDKDEKV